MIISLSKKFVYIHNPKTAGMSMENSLKEYGSKCRKGSTYYNHITCKEIHLNFVNLYKFGFVRNPWDRYVSMYACTKNSRTSKRKFVQNVDFTGFIYKIYHKSKNLTKKILKNHSNMWFLRQQYEYYYNTHDEIIVDFIGRFENISNDFNYVCNQLDMKTELPHINKSDRKPYQEYYTTETKELVSIISQKDIELFGYQF